MIIRLLLPPKADPCSVTESVKVACPLTVVAPLSVVAPDAVRFSQASVPVIDGLCESAAPIISVLTIGATGG